MKKRLFVALLCVLVCTVAGISLFYVINTQAPRPPVEADSNADDPEPLHSVPQSLTGSCGVERWSVKTGTDADVGLINLQSVTQTTIAALAALPAPSNLPSNNRIRPTETTIFQLHDTLTEFKLESDSDYHLVLSDGMGHTMIGEIPDPTCVGSSSPLLTDIRTARAAFDAKFTPTGNFQTANVPITVTGVGFFDFLHGQTGVAPNGIELHAVLDVQFGTSATPTPTATTPPTSTPTTLPTPTATTTGGTNLIQNGGFETSGSWTESGQSLPVRTAANVHSGSFSLQLGTTSGQQGDSIASQMVTIPPSTTKATLSFFYWPATNDTISFAWQEVDILNSNGQVLQQVFHKLSNNRAWTQVSFDVSRYAGQTIAIQFLDHEESNGHSFFAYMYVDDVAVTVQ
ncbi:MAG TPA: hypothetical protein VFB12_18910 [Ktedonobacteraceae bacterium]|nr:hypothetical protein [Ktedonobacteraceae bacterium]